LARRIGRLVRSVNSKPSALIPPVEQFLASASSILRIGGSAHTGDLVDHADGFLRDGVEGGYRL
jgi:hypothetical protein